MKTYRKFILWIWLFISTAIFVYFLPEPSIIGKIVLAITSAIFGRIITFLPLLAEYEITKSKEENWKPAPLWAVLIAVAAIGTITYFAYPAIKAMITGDY